MKVRTKYLTACVGLVAAGAVFLACSKAENRSRTEPNPKPTTRDKATTAVTKTPWASANKELTIVNAYDAFGEPGAGMVKDFGFSAVIRYGGKTILFDSGTRADIFEGNLKALGITAKDIDIAIASHAHHDHIAGFDYLLRENPKVQLLLPKDFFGLGSPLTFSIKGKEANIAKTLAAKQRYFGGKRDLAKNKLESTGRFWKANVRYIESPTQILPGLTILPTTSKLMGTFVRYPPFGKKPKLIGLPELSASFSTSKGEVLVVGCSHSSVEEIVKAASKAGKGNIRLLTGGFHLLPYDRTYLEALAKRLKKEYAVKTVAPCHCTGHLAFSILKQQFGDKYYLFGLGSKIEL